MGGMTRQPTQLAKVTPFASGNEGTSEKAPKATFSNEGLHAVAFTSCRPRGEQLFSWA
jgi:hypothetical protein